MLVEQAAKFDGNSIEFPYHLGLIRFWHVWSNSILTHSYLYRYERVIVHLPLYAEVMAE